jgi:hypothetical protein
MRKPACADCANPYGRSFDGSEVGHEGWPAVQFRDMDRPKGTQTIGNTGELQISDEEPDELRPR